MTWQKIQNVRDHHHLHVRLQVHREPQEEVHPDLEVPGSPEDLVHCNFQIDLIVVNHTQQVQTELKILSHTL